MRAGPVELEGVVVGTRVYGESDRIVDLLTGPEGRVSVLARGGRASRRRFAGALDLFVGLRVQVIPRGSLWTLQGADVLDARVGIRASLEAIERATRLVECARLLTAEHQPSESAHAVLVESLDAVAAGELARAAEGYPALLRAAGLLPDLERCERCGAPEPVILDGPMALCPSCAPGRRPTATPVLAVLRGQPCSDPRVGVAVEGVVARWVEGHTGRALRSLASTRRVPLT